MVRSNCSWTTLIRHVLAFALTHTLGLSIDLDEPNQWQHDLDRIKPVFTNTQILTLRLTVEYIDQQFVDTLLFKDNFLDNITKLKLIDEYYHDFGCSDFACALVLQHRALFNGLPSLSNLRSLSIYLPGMSEGLRSLDEGMNFFESLHQYLVNNGHLLKTFKFPKHSLNPGTLDYLCKSPNHSIMKLSIFFEDHIPMVIRPFKHMAIAISNSFTSHSLDDLIRSKNNFVQHIKFVDFLPSYFSISPLIGSLTSTSLSLNFEVLIRDDRDDIVPMFIEQLSINKDIIYIYHIIPDNYAFCDIQSYPKFQLLDKCIQSHPTIQNKSSWYWDRRHSE
ncbi:hypothetical protein SAMD00019534_059380 [Acytostelium subglobosum LB1]|uniref:hypothetical protein n=1 Tax=Acytostelium subglobosum LB1 TaxID=1410327 RepID=UPI000644A7F3|nr:hypothetical protein SAMD00019534_059380 [Acytostelium subglobosum LB1]GAM22763.1 hypothetical protein SAMD00019534_059380 [Acytostelium subglobosum LB1]|eukprot:XP_012753990.1 hypothetical protein SAMD00019534_059380 [Acytostelium subglobosum LB1]